MGQDSRLSQLLKTNLIPILLGSIGLVLVGIGLFQVLLPHTTSDLVIEQGTESKGQSSVTLSPKDDKKIMVDIEGAVQSPGVYELSSDSRIKDALLKAGGMSAKADRQTVSKTLNMASHLSDGAKLYIPIVGEQASIVGSLESVAGTSTSVISINAASPTELDTLPGVGTVTAAKIISNRPYATVDELVSKKAVTKAVFEKIKSLISL